MNTQQMTEFRAIKHQCSSGQFRSINVASKARSDAIVAAWDEIERLREALGEAIRAIESLPEEILGIEFHGGTVDNPDYHFIKDELLDNLRKALGGDE